MVQNAHAFGIPQITYMSKFSRLDDTKMNRMRMNAFKSDLNSVSVSLISNLAVAILFLTTHLASPAQDLDIHSVTYATRGNPTSAVFTRDGRSVFVSVTNVDQPDFPGPDSAAGSRTDAVSGVEVFRRDVATHKVSSVGFVRTGSTGANGLVLLPQERTLAIGVGDEGVAFLDVRDLEHGKGTPRFAHQTPGAGTFDVVATPDGRYVFSSNEYGIVAGQRGSVGVISTGIDQKGRVRAPHTLGQIPTGDVVPSLAISPDGSRLYVASELVPQSQSFAIAGSKNPLLSKNDCVQKQGSPARPNGYISVVDVQRAFAIKPESILARVASGCSPVRIVEAADASRLYVSARGDNSILEFDPQRLENDSEHSLLRSFASGGTAPVGMRLFMRDRFLAVANSNRFAESNGNLAIHKVDSSTDPEPHRIPAGGFPRNLSLSADGSTIYLTNYKSRTLQVLDLSH